MVERDGYPSTVGVMEAHVTALLSSEEETVSLEGVHQLASTQTPQRIPLNGHFD